MTATRPKSSQWSYRLSIASIFCYGVSFLLPAFDDGEGSTIQGYYAFLLAFCSLNRLMAQAAISPFMVWWANPLFWFSIGCYCKKNFTLAACLGAVASALGSVYLPRFFEPGILVGYYVWVGSMYLLTIASLINYEGLHRRALIIATSVIALVGTLALSRGFEDKVENESAVHAYAARGDVASLKSLLRRDRTLVDSLDSEFAGNTPLHTAAETGQPAAAEVLLKYGAKTDARNHGEAFTPLHTAAHYGQTEVVRVLLDHKADVDVEADHGFTPLCEAAGAGHRATAELLLARGAKINGSGDRKAIPLKSAAIHGNRSVVELLVEKGADVNATDPDGRNAVYWATIFGNKEVAEYLVAKGARQDFLSAVVLGDVAFVAKELQAKPELINTHAPFDATWPIHLAARSGQVKMLELLLDHKADVNTAFYGTTPLHLAAVEGQTQAAEFLLAHGANVNAKDDRGETPLHNALCKNQSAVAKLLVEHGADVNAADKNLSRPLDFAITYLNPGETLELLLARGANPNAPDQWGTTPLQSAVHSANADIYLPLLRKHATKDAGKAE